MKYLASILTIIAIIFSMTACSASKVVTEEMYVQKDELTEQEQSILEFVGSEKPPYILNFLVDDTVQSLQINTYELQGNEWHLITGGGGTQFNETNGRIALTFDNIGLGLRTAVEHKGSNSYKTERDFDFDGLSTTTSYLTDKIEIEYEKEIPLVIQIHTSKDTISSLSPEHGFYEPETFTTSNYEKAYAITCLFSQKTVNELSEQTAK